MPELPRTAASVMKYRKIAYIAASIGTAFAIGVCAFIGMGPTEYESQAVLSYTATTDLGSDSPILSAKAMAARALDDQHLNTILDGFGLYPEMREGPLQLAAVRRLRSNISITQAQLSQKKEVAVHLDFRDTSPLKGPAVANALADVLATYNAPAATSPPPSSAEADSPAQTAPALEGTAHPPNSMELNSGSTATSAPVTAIPKTDSGNLGGLTRDQLRRKMNWIDGQLADLATEQSTLHAASLTVQGHISQLQASGREEDAAPREPARPVVDPNASTRTQLTQQLAAEQQKLAALRERYTEAYPDVVATQLVVNTLQAKLAALPPTPRQVAAPRHVPDLYQSNMDQLTAEESKLGEKLRNVEHSIAGLEHYRERVRSAMQSASDTASALALPAEQPPALPSAAPASVKPPVHSRRGGVTASPLTAGGPQNTVDRPFRIVTPASNSVPVHSVSPTILASIGGGWVVLMLLCFAPLRWMQSAVVSSESDVRATIPRQVAYLGNIRRIIT